MRVRGVISLAAIAFLAVACGSKDYRASFVVAFPPPPKSTEPVLFDPPDASTITQIMVSARFWTKYVEPRLNAETDKTKIRSGFNVGVKDVKSAAAPGTFEVDFRFGSGGEPAFEAVKEGFMAYLNEGLNAGDEPARVLSVQKPEAPSDSPPR